MERQEIKSSSYYISLEEQYGAHNYNPLPVVLEKGKGVFVWDVEGKRYYDFLSSYSAVNQGHSHSRLLEVAKAQLEKITLTSRAFHNNWLGESEKFLAEAFGFQKVLLMNSGVEAVESAVKLARKWGYEVKGVPNNQALIVTVSNNFHGRTMGVISFSTDNQSRINFGPHANGYINIPYNNTELLEEVFEKNPNIVGFLFEPIQGEAGVIVPDEGYCTKVRELCSQYNVLMIADEIQTGLGRTGKMLCLDYERVHPDILILGKALSGGILPASAVLSSDEVMLTLKPGEHGSTFGGNPLAARIAIEAVKIVREENLSDNAMKMGLLFRERMDLLMNQSNKILQVRGKGLLNAIKIDNEVVSIDGYGVCLLLKEKGLLAKQTHGNVIRFAPPLVINEEQLNKSCSIIEQVINSL